MSEAWRVMDQMVRLVREGRVKDERIAEALKDIRLTANGKVGTYVDGMMKTPTGNVTLDPVSIIDFSSAPEPKPKAKVVRAKNKLKLDQST